MSRSDEDGFDEHRRSTPRKALTTTQRPFVPFRITLSDGRVIELNRQLGFAVGGKMMIVAQERPPALRINLDQVASIKMLEPIA